MIDKSQAPHGSPARYSEKAGTETSGFSRDRDVADTLLIINQFLKWASLHGMARFCNTLVFLRLCATTYTTLRRSGHHTECFSCPPACVFYNHMTFRLLNTSHTWFFKGWPTAISPIVNVLQITASPQPHPRVTWIKERFWQLSDIQCVLSIRVDNLPTRILVFHWLLISYE